MPKSTLAISGPRDILHICVHACDRERTGGEKRKSWIMSWDFLGQTITLVAQLDFPGEFSQGETSHRSWDTQLPGPFLISEQLLPRIPECALMFKLLNALMYLHYSSLMCIFLR